MQAIVVATLGSRAAAQRVDSMREGEKGGADNMFYLQYFFPPSSVGEVGRVGGPGECESGGLFVLCAMEVEQQL